MAIERAASMVKRAILQTSKLFLMELRDEETGPLNEKLENLRRAYGKIEEGDADTKQRLEKQMETVQEQLDDLNRRLDKDEKRFKKELKKSNFVMAYGEMIKSALLLGFGDLKRMWNFKADKLRYENIDVLNLYVSPDYMPFEDENPDYLIEFKEMPLAKLRKMAKSVNEGAGEDIFDMEELEKIKAGEARADKETQVQQRRGLSMHARAKPKVQIYEFWGTVISKDGKDMKENQLMMLVNEKHLIRIQDNPFNDGKFPHDLTVPIVYPHRGSAGTSLVESGVRMQYTLNNILNMVIDNLNFSVNKVFTYNPSALKRPGDVFSIYPGKMIPVTIGGEHIKEVRTSQLGQDVFKVFELLGKELQEATAVTEFLMGMAGKGQKTLGEIEIKTDQSQGMFDVIARELEANSITPILRGSYNMLVQFSDYKGEYEFNVGGLSLLLLKREQTQTLLKAIEIALKSPVLQQVTKIEELWKKLLDIWNFGDVYREPEEQIAQPQLQAGQPQLPAGGAGQPVPRPQMSPDQKIAINQKAAEDARKLVAQMSPQEVLNS